MQRNATLPHCGLSPPHTKVAETRQLKEEEEVLMWRAANAMQQLYGEIMQVREAQGYWGTNLQLTVLQRPPEEVLWSMVRQTWPYFFPGLSYSKPNSCPSECTHSHHPVTQPK